jgi:hypothetical protein
MDYHAIGLGRHTRHYHILYTQGLALTPRFQYAGNIIGRDLVKIPDFDIDKLG